MDDDVIVIYDEYEEEPEQFTAPNYEYMLAQALLTREAIQEKLRDPSENSNFQFIGGATHNNSIWNNFLAVTYGGVEQNFFKCRDCTEIFDKDPQKSLGQMRSHNCRIKTEDEYGEPASNQLVRSRKSASKNADIPRILTREEILKMYANPKEKKLIVLKSKPNFKCFAWQFLDVVLYQGLKQPFARCRYCGVFVPYSNKNGTTSIRKHALRCPHILRAKRGKQNANSPDLLDADIEKSNDEGSELESTLFPKVEIYSEDEDSKMEVESVFLDCAQLSKLYNANKDSKAFLFRKTKRKELKGPFWNICEEVYYNDVKQDCVRCTMCDSLVSGVGDQELALHIANHNSKNLSAKKSLPIKKEKVTDTVADVKTKPCLKKQSPSAAVKLELSDYGEVEEISETLSETTNIVAHNLVDFVVTTTGQSLSFIEDPSFRILAQGLIRLGALHGDRNANDFLPTIDSVLKQSVPMRVRGLKIEIRELMAKEPHLSLSVDLIKADTPPATLSYLTVKTHIVTNTFVSRVYVLGATELQDKVTHETVQDAFLSIMNEYIKTDDLHTRCIMVINENNEVLVKAFETYTRLPSVTHSLDMIVNEVLQVKDPELNISDTVVKIQDLFEHITTAHNYSLSKGECLLDLLEEFYEMNKPIEKLLKHTRSCQRDHSAFSDISKNTVKTTLNGFQVIKLCVDTIRQNQITINGILLWKKKLVEQYSPVLYEHRQNARLKQHTLELIQSKFIVDQPIYKIALFLNPNFKSLKFLSEAERQEVFNSIKDIFLKRFQAECTDAGCDHESDVIDKEVNRYYATKSFDYANEDLLEFWKKITLFPHLRILARHVLSIPGTSDGVSEEVFQKANRSLSSGIGTTTDYNNIIFLHSNFIEV